MKFVLASYGSRGDVEPCAAVGRELLRRGHEVRMAVPPDLVGFVESAGLAAVAYGPDTQRRWTRTATSDGFIPQLLEDPRSDQVVARILGARYPVLGGDEHDADVAGGRRRPATHRPEFRGAPLPTSRSITTFRWPRCITSRLRANGQLLPFLPAPLIRSAMTVTSGCLGA